MEQNNAFNSKSATYVLGHLLPISPVQTKGGRRDFEASSTMLNAAGY